MEPFWSALLAALFAGLVAVGVTLAIERWGGLIGGVIGTLPTTIVPAALGIAAEARSAEAFAAAMHVAPAGMLLNAGFLYLWRILPPRLPAWSLAARLALMVTVSLTVWLCAAVLTVNLVHVLRSSDVPLLVIGLGTTLAMGLVGIGDDCHSHPSPPSTFHSPP